MGFFTPQRITWLYHVNPAFKFIVFVLLLCVALINRNFEFALNQMIVYLLVLILFCGYSWKKTALLLLPFLFVFMSTATSMILFGKGEHMWWTWGLIRISEESFFRGMVLGLKTCSCGMMGMVFALTSKPILFFYALMQQFRMPPKFAYSFIASIRMLPMIMDEFHIRSNVLKIRGKRYARGVKGWYQRLSQYAIPLLAQSIRRAQRVAVAMEAKRFQMSSSRSRTYYYTTSYSRFDAAFIAVMLFLVTFAFVLSD
ncbi:energy-coupling factor transporter transmembrane protein EcfT [Paenibacillus albiflavus]|uniref:Energy-coupling factor transporter transmembrane protein EcfT n=1 Tax=Paenibacillus albiflavus TaxID=2545760 RepID=A0A4R4EDW0_9BACL|nr:energy-coupling factor transporter transmembrane component T [Paenibacillus albiflavus]TCZ77393.1 energy-coupling factor transporter transmembrane protein EcfT [Paenibacillus albiflavus]